MLALKIPQEHKMLLVDRMRAYFDAEMSQTIGHLAAENLLDFMLKQLSPMIYNQAISDACTVVLQQMERTEEEIYALKQPLEFLKRD